MSSIAWIEAHERRKLMRGDRREGAKTVYIFKLELGSLNSTPTPLSFTSVLGNETSHTLVVPFSVLRSVERCVDRDFATHITFQGLKRQEINKEFHNNLHIFLQ